MSTPQRLLLALSLLVAAGAVAGALLMGGGEPASGPTVAGPTPGQSPGRTPTPRQDLEGLTQENRVSAEGEPAGQLRVRVIDPHGAAIPAEVRLTGSDGREIYAEGSTSWDGFPVGEWALRARTDDLIVYRETFTVAEGQTTRVTAQLLSNLEIKGRVVDRFGQGVGPLSVWFMRREQTHPADLTTARRVQNCTTDSRGVFKTELDKKGPIRVSVGRPGHKLVESEVIDFHSGGPKEITAVVGGTGRLEVELESPPPALAEGKANLVVTVLSERGERGEGPRKRRGSGAAGKRKDGEGGQARELRGGRGAGESTTEEAELSAQQREALRELGYAGEGTAEETGVADPPIDPSASTEPNWVTLAEARIPSGGSLSFEALPPDRELVIQLTRRGDRFRSQPILLVPDRASVLRFRVPVKRSQDERAAQPYGDLPASVQQRPLPAGAPEVGITWK